MNTASRESERVRERLACCKRWPEQFPPEQWAVYKGVLQAVRASGIPFAIGGGLAARAYAGDWRNSKDIDLYIRPSDRDAMIQLLTQNGLKDYFERLAYDRRWIYRSYKHDASGDTIVDVIWAMANQRAQVTDAWLSGPELEIGGERLRLLAPEQAVWSKLYVLQRDRCDWPDAMDVLYSVAPVLDWRELLVLVAADKGLLRGLLAVFAWITPERARSVPDWVWPELGMGVPAEQCGIEESQRRVRLLDSRPWFTGVDSAASAAAGDSNSRTERKTEEC